MLKSSIERPAEPAVFLITLGVLKGYLKSPLKMLISASREAKKINKIYKNKYSEDFLKTTSFMAGLYIVLSKKSNEKTAFEIVKAVVNVNGLAVQQAGFRNVETDRSIENLIKYQQLINKEGPTKSNTMEVVNSDKSKYEFKITKCMFYEFFNDLKIPELTKVMCSIDNAIFNTYLPDEYIFHRKGSGNRIADGKKECIFVIENSNNFK